MSSSSDSGSSRDITATSQVPSTMRLVIMREIRIRGRSGAFIISTALTLLLVLGGILLPSLIGGDGATYRVGSVGDGNQPIIETASALADASSDGENRLESRTFDDVSAAEAALNDGEIDAVLIDGNELIVAAGGLDESDVQELLQQAAGTQQVEAMVGQERAGQVISALTSEALTVRSVSGGATDENQSRGWIAYGGLVLMYIIILTYGVWTLNGVTEEKSNRVIELLLATARPWQLLTGKIVGISLLGVAQFVVTVALALVAIRVTGTADGTADLPVIPVDMLAILTLWIVLGFGIYMVICGAAGALASKMEDAQNVMTPISLLAVVSFFLSFQVLNDPDGVAAIVATFVPFSAPFVVPIRAAFGALPLWQHVAAVALAAISIALALWLGGRVYAGGALQFGGRIKWREAFRHAEL